MESSIPRPSRAVFLRIIASILIALVLWGIVTTLRDPETTRSFSNIPVAAQGLGSDLVLLGALPDTQIRVTGPESVVEDIAPETVSAVVDLTEISGPGTYSVQVAVVAPDDVWRSESTPDSVEISVDSAISAEIELLPVVEGIVDESLRTATVDPSVERVQATGPASMIDRIDHVALPVDVAGRVGQFEASAEPVAVDQDNEPVEGVSLSPSSVDVVVEVTSRGKRVAVLATTSGTPGPGFEVIERTTVPASILIDGSDEALDQIIALSTNPVDISGATSTVAESVSIRDVPDEITILEPASGMVDVLVQIDQRGVNQLLPGQRVTVVNLADDMVAFANPVEVDIEVVAPEEVLESLTPDSIQVVVDANGLEPGEHIVVPTVNLPARVHWVATDPIEIELTIASDDPQS